MVARHLHVWPFGLRRLCDEPNTIAVSIVVEDDEVAVGLAVDHLLLDCEDLVAMPLAEWVAENPDATHLLDPENGQIHGKVSVPPGSNQVYPPFNQLVVFGGFLGF